MKPLTICCLLLLPTIIWAQQWVDTTFSIQSEFDIAYGLAVDFAGNERQLSMDISYPTDDSMPQCGRPTLVMVHGGAFIAGNKGEGIAKRIREDFARRGYTTASIGYRLGQFQTHQQVHCNASNFGLEWDCLNMADSSEWYRAWYRGVQDVKGAIRYLVNHAEDYGVDANNLFVVGESAGGFIALGVGFLDDTTEVLSDLIEAYPDALPPNTIYEAPCIQHPTYNLDTSIASMDLMRPDLGSYEGTLNLPLTNPYTIKAVGNIYGAVFNHIFHTSNASPPALYLYHQPNDLIVPYTSAKVLGGFAYCATQFPFGCQYIINRPTVYGSKGIKDMLDTMIANQALAPDYVFDNTMNTANCAQQILTPSLQGHSLDAYGLRTGNMATFFASKVGDCMSVGIDDEIREDSGIILYPNPANESISIEGPTSMLSEFRIINMIGQDFSSYISITSKEEEGILLNLTRMPPGMYILRIPGQTLKFYKQ